VRHGRLGMFCSHTGFEPDNVVASESHRVCKTGPHAMFSSTCNFLDCYCYLIKSSSLFFLQTQNLQTIPTSGQNLWNIYIYKFIRDFTRTQIDRCNRKPPPTTPAPPKPPLNFWQVIASGKALGQWYYQNRTCTRLLPRAPLFW
jgi:hypothetical protein